MALGYPLKDHDPEKISLSVQNGGFEKCVFFHRTVTSNHGIYTAIVMGFITNSEVGITIR